MDINVILNDVATKLSEAQTQVTSLQEVFAPQQGEKVYSAEEAQALVREAVEPLEARIAELEAAQPVDMTPFSQADLDAYAAEQTKVLKARVNELELKLTESDKDKIEETLADQLALFVQGLRDRTQAAAPVETPVEEPVEPAPPVDEEPVNPPAPADPVTPPSDEPQPPSEEIR